MVSHRYHMETGIVGYDAEAQKDIKASRLVIHGLIAQNVEDIVIEQEKKRRSVRTQGAKAETWLVGFLAGKGEVPSNWVINAGEKAGYSKDAVHRARRNLGDRVVVTSLPVVPRTTTWRLFGGVKQLR
jgi:hypothetical protein